MGGNQGTSAAEARSKFVDLPAEEVEAVIDEAVAAVRKAKNPAAG